MKLYHRPDCPFCWKVRLFLSEIGVEVEEIAVELGKKHPDVVALNPNASVPVLISDGLVLYESAIIIEYLVDKFPEYNLMPGSAEQRAVIRQIHNDSDTKIGKILFPFIKKVRESDGSVDIKAELEEIAPAWQGLQKSLSEKLADKTFFFDAFSVAECALIPRLSLAVGYGLTFDDDFKNLEEWLLRLVKRPSFLAVKPEGFAAIDEMLNQ